MAIRRNIPPTPRANCEPPAWNLRTRIEPEFITPGTTATLIAEPVGVGGAASVDFSRPLTRDWRARRGAWANLDGLIRTGSFGVNTLALRKPLPGAFELHVDFWLELGQGFGVALTPADVVPGLTIPSAQSRQSSWLVRYEPGWGRDGAIRLVEHLANGREVERDLADFAGGWHQERHTLGVRVANCVMTIRIDGEPLIAHAIGSLPTGWTAALTTWANSEVAIAGVAWRSLVGVPREPLEIAWRQTAGPTVLLEPTDAINSLDCAGAPSRATIHIPPDARPDELAFTATARTGDQLRTAATAAGITRAPLRLMRVAG